MFVPWHRAVYYLAASEPRASDMFISEVGYSCLTTHDDEPYIRLFLGPAPMAPCRTGDVVQTGEGYSR